MITFRPFIKELSTFLDNDYFDDLKKPWRKFDVDVVEVESGLEIHAVLPGMKKSDIRIELNDNTLRISADVKNPYDLKDGFYNRIERTFGETARTFNIADRFDTGMISAKYENGILVLFVPRKEEQKQEVIKIEIE